MFLIKSHLRALRQHWPGSRFQHALCAGLLLALLALPYPAPVQAVPSGAVTLQFDIVEVHRDQTVAIRTVDFPMRTHFTVSMEVAGKGTGPTVPAPVVIDTLDTGPAGGAIEAVYPIPASLRGQLILALRLQSPDGYQAYRWFINEDLLPKPADEKSAQPELTFSAVKQGVSVTVEAKHLPANVSFWVRLGPADSFFKNYAVGDRVTSGADGSARFTLSLPQSLQASPYITVRMDYGTLAVTGTYQNVNGGQAVDPQSLIKFEWCRVVNTAPVPTLSPGEEFDAVWTVQNISAQTWQADTFGYKFKSGEKVYKYNDSYAIHWTIRDGWSFDVAVDMIAPQEPGWHTTRWVMFKDNENSEKDSDMCEMKLTFFVGDK